MLMCDSCGLAYHLQCLRPPLQVVPSGETWICVACLRAGVTSETLGEPAKHADWDKHLVTKVSIRPRDVKNLVGKVACRKSGGSGPGRKAPEYGLVAFKGAAHAPECFEVRWRPSGDLVSYKKGAVTKLLVKGGAPLPRDLVLGLQVASLRAAVEDADLTTVAGVTGLLAFLMPGTFAPDWLASLARWATRNLEGLMPWSAGAEVSALLEGVDLTLATTFADPWSGGALVRARLARAQLRLRCIEGVGGGLPLSLPYR